MALAGRSEEGLKCFNRLTENRFLLQFSEAKNLSNLKNIMWGSGPEDGAQTPERLILPNIISLCLIYHIILVKPLAKPS